MARIVDTLYDQTSGAGAALTADLETSRYSALLCVTKATGAAAPTGYAVTDLGSAVQLDTLTAPGIGGSNAQGIGPAYTKAWPVPRSTRITITGGAASTVRLVVYGIQES